MKLQDATDIKLGTTSASKVMLGTTQVWPLVTPTPVHMISGTLTDPTEVPVFTFNFENSQKVNANVTGNIFYIDNEDTTNVVTPITSLRYFIGANLNITRLDTINFDTSSVTNMHEMFWHCRNLTYIDLSHLNTSSVTKMTEMFYNCSSLTSLDLTSFNTSSVTTMTSMFEACNRLQSLDLSNFDMTNVTNINRMFISCWALTSLDIRGWHILPTVDHTLTFRSLNSPGQYEINVPFSDIYIDDYTTLCTFTNNLTAHDDDYIPDTATIHYNDGTTQHDYVWTGNSWT